MDVGLIDNSTGRFREFKEHVDIYGDHADSMDKFVGRFKHYLKQEKMLFVEVQMATDGRATMNDFLKEIRPLVVLITDVSFVIESMSLRHNQPLSSY